MNGVISNRLSRVGLFPFELCNGHLLINDNGKAPDHKHRSHKITPVHNLLLRKSFLMHQAQYRSVMRTTFYSQSYFAP
ncbi:hypothetical protein [Proteus phage vB_PmiP_RS51pmB]|nr:hypothetical protein [Proteus phage vB_PmiP_RS51pmB]